MDPSGGKKSYHNSEKSNTIIKIKLSDMLGPPTKIPLEIDENPESSSLSSQQEEDSEEVQDSPSSIEDPEQDLSNEISDHGSPKQEESFFPAEEGIEEGLSSLRSSSSMSMPSRHIHGSLISNEVKDGKDFLEEEKSMMKGELFQEGMSMDTEKRGKNIKKENLGNNIEQTPVNNTGQFWKFRKQNKLKQNNVLMDYTNNFIDSGENMKISLERASNFNDFVLHNRKKIKEITKNLERQKLTQRFALDNSNCVFPSLFIPLLRYEEGKTTPIYENNGCLELEKDSVQKFIELNVAHEHSTFEHPSKYAMFYQKRFPRKRRRRRNANKHSNEGANNEDANKT